MSERDQLIKDLDQATRLGDDELATVISKKIKSFDTGSQFVADPKAGMTHQAYVPSYRPGTYLDLPKGIVQGFKDQGFGLAQRALELTEPKAAAIAHQDVADKRAQEEALNKSIGRKPPLETLGEFVGGAIPAVTASVIGGPSLIAGGISGLIGGALQPTASNAESITNAALGGVGGVAGTAVGRAILPTSARNMTVAQRELNDIARSEGIPLRTSEATGSSAIKNFEQMAANRPITAGMEQKFNEEQTKAINRAITRRIGSPVNEINPSTLKSLGDEAGSAVGQYVKGKNVDLQKKFFDSIVKLDTETSAGGVLTQTPEMKKLINDALDVVVSKKTVPGETAQKIKSMLQDRMRDAFNSDKTELGDSLRTIVNGLDDSIADTMSAAELEGWKAARRKYANFKVLEDVMSRPTRSGAYGDVPANRLASALERSMGTSYSKGTADLADLARLGQIIQPPGRSALLGESGIPGIRNAQDVGRMALMPVLQSPALGQAYLTGRLPLQPLLMNSPASLSAMDSILRYVGSQGLNENSPLRGLLNVPEKNQ